MRKILLFLWFLLLPMLANAYDAEIDGIYYNFSGNNATVTYRDYSYNSYSGTVVIPESVTYGDKTYSVTSIDYSAFEGCSGLTSVTIPNSVTSIGYYAFRDCSGLVSVTLKSNAIVSLNRSYNSSLGSIFGAQVKEYVIGDSVTSIGNVAFQGCSGLTSITIPNSVTSIGHYAFYECSNLTNITIPESLTSIGSDVFSGTAWYDNQPNGLIYFGKFAYKYKGNMPETETSIVIKEGTQIICGSAFEDCTGLTSVTIPNSVTSIGNYAFYCKLRNVLVKSTTPPMIEYQDEVFSDQTLAHGILYVPEGSWDAYAFDDSWYAFDDIREVTIEEEQLSAKQAYALMDAGTFAYSVYDPINERISTISRIDENNPNHCWQVIEVDGERYLYNLGAKKFAAQSGNAMSLTDSAKPIGMGNGKDGIVLGEQQDRQWAFVKNEYMNAEDNIADAVDAIEATADNKQESCFDLQGRQQNKPQKGMNIIRYSNGSTRKVLMK